MYHMNIRNINTFGILLTNDFSRQDPESAISLSYSILSFFPDIGLQDSLY